MPALKFHGVKSPLFISIILLSHFLTISFSYSCPSLFSPLNGLHVDFYQRDICSQVSLSTHYRLSGTGSLSCSTSTTASVLLSNSNPITQGLCSMIISSNPIPYKFEDPSTCPVGGRRATYDEAVAKQNDICLTLGSYDIVNLPGSGSIKGTWYGGGTYCPIESSEPLGPGADVLCIQLNMIIEVVSSGEIICSSPCKTCSGTATHCLTCLIGFPYFYNNNCYIDCPTNTYASSWDACSGN